MMNSYKTLIFSFLLLPLLLHAQKDPILTQRLHALNKHVTFMNSTDRSMMNLCVQLTYMNEQMLAFHNGDKSIEINYNCSFVIPKNEFQQAVYNQKRIDAVYQPKIAKSADSLMATMQRIKNNCNKLSSYLNEREYRKDEMYQGFEYLGLLKKDIERYLLRHEGLYAHLLNAWYTYNPKERGFHPSRIVTMMREAMSKGHQVYIALWYDPDMNYSYESFGIFNEALTQISDKYNDDEGVNNIKAYNKFVAPWSDAYIDKFEAKGTIPFYRQCNQIFAEDFNQKQITAFNNFVRAKGYETLEASMLPPMLGIIKPYIEKPTEEEPEPEPIVVEPEPEVVVDTVEEIVAVEETPEEEKVFDENKPSALEGYVPSNMVLLVDVSGSMRKNGRLDSLKNSFKALLGEMRAEDYVSIVLYSGDAKVALPPTSASEKERIWKVINGLQSEGKTNFHEGLRLALAQTGKGFLKEGNNRIILATDGGNRISQSTADMLKYEVQKGVRLSVFYYGSWDSPNLGQFKLLSKVGKGNFVSDYSANSRDLMLKEAQAIRKK